MDPNQQMQGISPEDEKRMATMIEGMQTRDSLRMYNNLVEKCFDTCVQSFRRKTLEKDEERCVSKCCEKFLKHSSRVSMRFAELNQVTQPPGH
mmetsp:Transcript_2134/g.6919  ORF Transcript_2134/g.6919 Transcript_2134/m.6919 type:complete len:93 (+) Transcript_2134:181-459(+)